MTVLFDPLRLLATLARHGVRYIVIGGVAAVAQGSPIVTNDLDVCYDNSPENLERLAAALKQLGATLRGAPMDVPFLLDARMLQMGDHFTFDTDAGPFDIMATPAGTNGFEELLANAVETDFEGFDVLVASVDDLIRMKRVAFRAKDRVHLENLGALRDELEERGAD